MMMYRCFRTTALIPVFLSWDSSTSMVMGFVTHPRIRKRKNILTHPYSTFPSSSTATNPPSRLLSVPSPEHDNEDYDDEDVDSKFLYQAVEYARKGLGYTFPNPAVGCVLVNQSTQQVLGAGFHPKAGYPHAEIFALFEAAGYIPSGVEAAQAVVNNIASAKTNNGSDGNENDDVLLETIQKLTEQYISDENGPNKLFGNCFEDIPVTAYVTLEPCCHYGQTPPCAATFGMAKVDRVVIGYRDPNPKVDGGGVSILQKSFGIDVDLLSSSQEEERDGNYDDDDVQDACYDLVKSFVKRIIPKDYNTDYKWMNGARRSVLRSLANTQKREGSLHQINWSTGKDRATDEIDVDELKIDSRWIENLDDVLWREELVNLRLNKVVSKKKLAKHLGQRIANELGAHVVQSVGHTVLLYRPGIPPVLDLEAMLQQDEQTTNIPS